MSESKDNRHNAMALVLGRFVDKEIGALEVKNAPGRALISPLHKSVDVSSNLHSHCNK